MTAAAVAVRIVNLTVAILIANLLRWCRFTILPGCCHAVQHGACRDLFHRRFSCSLAAAAWRRFAASSLSTVHMIDGAITDRGRSERQMDRQLASARRVGVAGV